MTNALILISMIFSFLSTLFLIPLHTQWFNNSMKKHSKIEKKLELFIPIIVLSIIFGVFMAAAEFGGISRGISSPLPWEVWEIESLDGYVTGILALMANLLLLLWMFILPAHIYIWGQWSRKGRRLVYPYIINFLAGIIWVQYQLYN